MEGNFIMRDQHSYRPAMRNEARKLRVLPRWAAWVHANIKAHLKARAEQCRQARQIVALGHAKLAGKLAIVVALTKFWTEQLTQSAKATGRRVVWRILRDLGNIDAAKALV